ncbi:MAG: SHOCT domain-containing protein [Blastococcus sp.]
MPLLRGIARTAVIAGTATAVGGRVNRRQQRRWAAKDAPPDQDTGQQDTQQEAAPQVPEQRSAPSTADTLEQLKSLGELKAQGVLTESEFAVQKEKILHPA